MFDMANMKMRIFRGTLKAAQNNAWKFKQVSDWAVTNLMKQSIEDDDVRESISKFAAENMAIGS